MNEYYKAVTALKDNTTYLDALKALAGGIGARQVRGKRISPERMEALIWGLDHPSPVVRRRCLEILDNHPGDTAVPHIARRLDDPVPRVRWHAVHALTCETCKDGKTYLTPEMEHRIRQMAVDDPSPKVRRAAEHALGSGS